MSKKKQKRQTDNLSSTFDPNGSYTGIPKDSINERPIQDADDL